jgi:integrase
LINAILEQKAKLVHKEYNDTSAKIRKFLNYNHEEPARNQYYLRLTDLDNFVNSTYHTGVDGVLTKIESKKFYIKDTNGKVAVDQYDFMGTYLQYLSNKRKKDGTKLAASTIHDYMTTAKTFVETETEIVFKNKKYDNKVKLKQIIKGSKIPLPRETILKLINGCTQPNQARLKMILLLLSSCCSRIGESLLLRLSDLHLDGLPNFGTEPPYYPYIDFRGEITKTGKSRTTLLTNEMAKQLELWIKGKYDVRNQVINNDGKYKTVHHAPEMNQNDYLFLNIDSNYNEKDAALFVYNNLLQLFHKLLDNLELTQRTSNGQYAITPHKIRMGIRTEISSLVTDKEFPDFYLGHNISTYYNPSPEKYKEQFRLCQNALTYLDQSAIIKTQGNLDTRIDNIEEDKIAVLNKRLLIMEQDRKEDKERINRLLSLIVKESLVGKPIITKKNLDLIFSGELDAIPLSVSNREGEDVKHFTINKEIESIKNNYEEESKKLKPTLKSKGKSKLYILEDPPQEFMNKK